MTDRPIRIVINGFGRIGRSVLRLLATTRGSEGFELVAINDIAPLNSCAYLFQFDSVFGPFPGSVTHDDNNLVIDHQPIPFHQAADIRDLDLSEVDILLECTGAAGGKGACSTRSGSGGRHNSYIRPLGCSRRYCRSWGK